MKNNAIKKTALVLIAALFAFLAAICFRSGVRPLDAGQNPAGAPVQPAGGDGVYNRNGEVYVMIGSAVGGKGTVNQQYKGVWRAQDDNGSIIKNPTDDPSNRLMALNEAYYAIAVDQFRNIYALCSSIDPSFKPASADTPITPSEREQSGPGTIDSGIGIVGVAPNQYYYVSDYYLDNGFSQPDITNSDHWGSYGTDGKWGYIGYRCTDDPGTAHPGPYYGEAGVLVCDYGDNMSQHTGNKHCYEAYNDPNGIVTKKNIKYKSKNYQNVTNCHPSNNNIPAEILAAAPGRIIRKVKEGVFYETAQHPKTAQDRRILIKRWNFNVRRIDMAINHYVPSIPQEARNQCVVVPGTETLLENVFKTAAAQYSSYYKNGCGDPCNGVTGGGTRIIPDRSYLALAVTCAGRRYSYSSLPEPIIKQGVLQLIQSADPKKGAIFGDPKGVSSKPSITIVGPGSVSPHVPFSLSTAFGSLCSTTIGMGAATASTNASSQRDWLYVGPPNSNTTGDASKDDDFSVADQWDGLGGIAFSLKGVGANPAVTRYKMAGTAISGAPVNVPVDPKTQCICADGSGFLYYLTQPQAQLGGGGMKFVSYTSIKTGDVITQPEPIVSDLGKYAWKANFKVPVGCELWQVDSGRGQPVKNKLSVFAVGEDIYERAEYFSSINPLVLKNASPWAVQGSSSVAERIKLDLAVINIAGPPTVQNDRRCVDIQSSGGTPAKREISVTDPANPNKSIKLPSNLVDRIGENEDYTAKFENPPDFGPAPLSKNMNSGMALKDSVPCDGIIGGFSVSTIPGSIKYYFKVEMLEPYKRNVPITTLTKRPECSADWPSEAGHIEDWKMIETSKDDLKPAGEFTISFKEPGIYKVSMAATHRRYQYEKMPYPSCFNDRENFISQEEFLFFDLNNNLIKDPGEEFVAVRYVAVESQGVKFARHVKNISITGPQSFFENTRQTFTATFDVKYIHSFKHERGTPQSKELMEASDGIGFWDYPDTWPDNINFTSAQSGPPPGAETPDFPAHPTNYARPGDPVRPNYSGVHAHKRNFGMNPVDSGGNPLPVREPVWKQGGGTNVNPSIPLNKADYAAIRYEWYLAGQIKNPDSWVGAAPYSIGARPKEAPELPYTNTRLPGVKIASGNLAESGIKFERIPGSFNNTPVPMNETKCFKVTMPLEYYFDMPLEPGKYCLYLKLYYNSCKWLGSDEVKLNGDENTFTFYDVVPDSNNAEVATTPYNYASDIINGSSSEYFGFTFTVEDRQPPVAFYDNPYPDMSSSGAAKSVRLSSLPAAVTSDGATTGDNYPLPLLVTICDNNPNIPIKSGGETKIRLGANAAALVYTLNNILMVPDSEKRVPESADDILTLFKKIYEYNSAQGGCPITKQAGALPKVKTDDELRAAYNLASGEPVSLTGFVPNYDYDVSKAPFRTARFKLDANSIQGDSVPFDYDQKLGWFASSMTDGSKRANKINDFDGNNALNEETEFMMPDAPRYKTPAFIKVNDNDPPSVTFRVMDVRNNCYRQFAVDCGVKKADHTAFHDTTIVKDTEPGAGNIMCQAFGRIGYSVKAVVLSTFKPVTVAGLTNLDVVSYSGFPITQIDTQAARGSAITFKNGVYSIKPNGAMGGAELAIMETGKPPIERSFHLVDFSRLKAEGGQIDTIEVIQNSRVRIEIEASDNVDGALSLSLANGSIESGNANAFIAVSSNLGSQDEITNFINTLKTSDTNGTVKVVSYAIFRNPTIDTTQTPLFLLGVKDRRSNLTFLKIPFAIVHTYMKMNVINVENRRSE